MTIGPTHHWSDTPLVRHTIGPTHHWSDTPLVRHTIGPTHHWSDTPLVRHTIGPTHQWSDTPLVLRVVQQLSSASRGGGGLRYALRSVATSNLTRMTLNFFYKHCSNGGRFWNHFYLFCYLNECQVPNTIYNDSNK